MPHWPRKIPRNVNRIERGIDAPSHVARVAAGDDRVREGRRGAAEHEARPERHRRAGDAEGEEREAADAADHAGGEERQLGAPAPGEPVGQPAEEQISRDHRGRRDGEPLRRAGAIVARHVAQPRGDPEREERHDRALVRADCDRHAPEGGVGGEPRKAAQSLAQSARPARLRMLGHHERKHEAQRQRGGAERGEDLAPGPNAQQRFRPAPTR